nr:hypothetical protein 1 [Balneolaceae bacterium]
MEGKVWIYIDGKLVEEGSNDLTDDFRAYLRDRIDSNVAKGINDLFAAAEEAFGGTQDGKDGILVIDNNGGELTTITTTMTPTHSPSEHARRWRGEVEVSQARTLVGARIGHNFNSGSPDFFDTQFATRTFSSQHVMQELATLVIEWEIRIN